MISFWRNMLSLSMAALIRFGDLFFDSLKILMIRCRSGLEVQFSMYSKFNIPIEFSVVSTGFIFVMPDSGLTIDRIGVSTNTSFV